MLNKDRFSNANDMDAAFNADPCMHQTWCFPVWCHVEWTDDRIEYLKRLANAGIRTCALVKEIKRMERLEAKKEVR